MDSPLWVYLLGLVAMGVYGSRILIQWYLSEKHHRVESPGIYWVLSSLGAVLLSTAGFARTFPSSSARASATTSTCGTSA